MSALPRVVFTKPMNTGDSTLMMLLSLNLLLLVFFVMLNSMAAYGEKRVKEALAKAEDGLPVSVANAGERVREAPQATWRAGVLSRLQGIAANRLDLRITPQQGSADLIEIEMPAGALFDASGRLVKPELVRNLKAAAGTESTLTWQVKGSWEKTIRTGVMLAELAVETGQAEMIRSGSEGLRVLVRPGVATRPETGLQLQQMGESMGGDVQGVEGGAQ